MRFIFVLVFQKQTDVIICHSSIPYKEQKQELTEFSPASAQPLTCFYWKSSCTHSAFITENLGFSHTQVITCLTTARARAIWAIQIIKKMQDQVIAVIPAYPSCAGRVNSTLPDAWWLRLDRGETLHSPCQGTKTKHFQVPWDQQRNDKNILIGRSHSSINPVLSRQWMQIHKTSHFICPGAQRIIHLMIFPDVTLISYYLII